MGRKDGTGRIQRTDRTAARGRRRRRSAEEARRVILEAAERRLLRGGPESIRLQDIAADVGLSHPAILHHFGSREGLLTALVEHGLGGLQTQLLAGWPSRRVPDVSGTFDRFFRVAEERGYARLVAWLVLSGRAVAGRAGTMRAATERVHGGHARARQRLGMTAPPFEESQFIALLLTLLVFGDALFGPFFRRSLGLKSDAATARRFRAWVARRAELQSPSVMRAGVRRRQHTADLAPAISAAGERSAPRRRGRRAVPEP
jgi:AcrR family transcriptional regulator